MSDSRRRKSEVIAQPLPTLLSWALVAFTIEFDNESEHRLPHRTARHGSTPGAQNPPWLVSMAMWFNCLRFVDANGVTVRRLEQLARTKTNLDGMRRWGYIRIEPDPEDKRPKPPLPAWLIRPTRWGRKAQEIWEPLLAVIEGRWRQRFGAAEIDELRRTLVLLVGQFDSELPDCLPIVGYGLHSKERITQGEKPPKSGDDTVSLPLPSLLAKVLLQFAIEFETESKVSLAISANILRIAGGHEIRLRDLPGLAGVSKEAIAMALTFLTKRGYAQVKPESVGSRVKLLVLSSKGEVARREYLRLLSDIEQRWIARFGQQTMRSVRTAIEPLANGAGPKGSVLLRGVQPYPDGWRASVPRPDGLPHYPILLHRGAYPDGS